jgi:RecQ family ATP-dependent DNA helicase
MNMRAGDTLSTGATVPHTDNPQLETVRTTLADVFGFSDLRPGQWETIAGLLGGRDVLAVMPTGAGKSLCYQLPALVLGGLTVVVSPLVALMRDQVAALRLNGVAAATINSDHSREENVETWYDVRAGKVRLLYLSPERLMTERMLAALTACDVRLIAIDEAHCISQWGPAFRPEYAALAGLRARFPDVPIIGLTATADPATRDDIRAKIFGGDSLAVVTGFDRPNLSLSVALKENWKKQTAAFVNARRGQSGIVYCLSRRKTEDVAAMLRDDGHAALAFHAGMDSALKARVQDRFMTEPGIVIVATIAFGMGIDKPDIRYVLHTDLPGSPEAYYQEIGRAGRDGEPADTKMLYGLDDIRMRRVFIEQEDSAPDRKRREHKRLDSLIAYCEAPACRRRNAGGACCCAISARTPRPAATATPAAIRWRPWTAWSRRVWRSPWCATPGIASARRISSMSCAAPRTRRSSSSAMTGCPPMAPAWNAHNANGRASSARWSPPGCSRSTSPAMAGCARPRRAWRCCRARARSATARTVSARTRKRSAKPPPPRPPTRSSCAA